MASSASILAAGNPSLLVAFPGWKAPTLLRARATVSGGVVTPIAADTTPGVAIADAGTGLYTLTFPACRRIGGFNGNVSPATPATVANHRMVAFAPASNAAAAAGSIAFTTPSFANPPAVSDPQDGSTIDISFWADLG